MTNQPTKQSNPAKPNSTHPTSNKIYTRYSICVRTTHTTIVFLGRPCDLWLVERYVWIVAGTAAAEPGTTIYSKNNDSLYFNIKYKLWFERSEFLIDTSQKKSLRVCTRAMCSTSLGLRVSYYVPHTYVSHISKAPKIRTPYTQNNISYFGGMYRKNKGVPGLELATYRHAHQKQACTKQSA